MSANEKVFLASADGHAGAPTEQYKAYLEKRHHGAFDDYLAHHKWLWSPTHEGSFTGADLHDRMRNAGGYDPARGTSIAWDPDFRLREYDKAGITCEVLVPDDQNSDDPPFGAGIASAAVEGSQHQSYSPEWVRIGARAYNRWLADFCSADHKRLRGLTVLGTLDDVEWCIQELERAHASGLTTGVILPLEYSLPLYHHPRYDNLWAAIEAMNLTVTVHLSKGGPDWIGSDPRSIATMWAMEAAWFAQRPLWCLIVGGVLERHPNLRLAFTELNVDWVQGVLGRLDGCANSDYFAKIPSNLKLSLTPTDYFKRQCFVAHSAKMFVQRDHLDGHGFDAIPNMLWGSDLAHGEGFWPNCLEDLKPIVTGLSEHDIRQFLGERIVRAYPLHKSDYAALIQRIAPTAGELGLVDSAPRERVGA